MIRRGIGVQSFVSAGGGTDADAQAFITAAGITDATQQSAINTLVTDLKGYGIWSKMKAIWPFVGGTSSTHKWNLKDPRDLDAAFRLVFSGGITHSSTGALFNGTNGWANTFLNANTNLTNGNLHLSFYSRTNNTSQNYSSEIVLLALYNAIGNVNLRIIDKALGTSYFSAGNDNTEAAAASTTTKGFGIGTETSNSLRKFIKNGIILATNTTTSTTTLTNVNLTLMGNNSVSVYSNNEASFASIGDGLTDTEAANFYTSVQKYQTTLGRSVGTQTVSDADAQAFVNAAVIEDQVQATAINILVTDLKNYGIWSKMKAIYPFVGGTSSAHKFNLKDPRDLDAAYRLVFSGGWTHSSTGALPNGTNAYADSFLIPSSTLSATSTHFSYYSRTNTTTNNGSEIGSWNTSFSSGIELSCYRNWPNAKTYVNVNNATRLEATAQNSAGFFVGSRIANNNAFMLRNSSVIATQTATLTCVLPTFNVYISATNNYGFNGNYSTKECAFASIGDGLTTTEASNLYTAVQAYQTSLNRQV